MIKKRFGKTTMGCKKIKGSKAYRCSPLKPKKSKAKGKGRKSVKVPRYKYQKKVNTKRARRTPGTSKKTVDVKAHRRKK